MNRGREPRDVYFYMMYTNLAKIAGKDRDIKGFLESVVKQLEPNENEEQ
jgi:hypothetical protein